MNQRHQLTQADELAMDRGYQEWLQKNEPLRRAYQLLGAGYEEALREKALLMEQNSYLHSGERLYEFERVQLVKWIGALEEKNRQLRRDKCELLSVAAGLAVLFVALLVALAVQR